MSRPGILNTKERYGVIAQLLHWAVALLILMLLPLGKYMHGLPISTSDEIAHKVWFYSLHKTLGMTVFAIALLRIFWAMISTKPEPIHPERRLETFVASFVHWVLYVAILLVPAVGFIHHAASVGFAPIWGPFPDGLPFIPKSVPLAHYTGLMHFLLAAMMGISVFLHIAGAIKHAVIDRDGTLSRMIPFRDVTLSGFVAYGRAGHRGPYQGHGGTPFLMALGLVGLLFLGGAGYQLLAGGNNGQVIEATEQTTAPNAPITPAIEGEASNQWVVDAANSELAITITQLGSPVNGKFESWDANIIFDPDNLDAARVIVKIDIQSLTLGTVTDQAKSADFLDATRFPEAVFEAAQFVKTDDGYLAKGSLALHGVKLPLELPFSLSITGNQAGMTASTNINRIAYGIGAEGFADEGSVAFDVAVDVTLVANK